MSAATPDFEMLGRTTYWPADDWQQAWAILVSDERPELWSSVVDLGPYSRPTTAAKALLDALHGEVGGTTVPTRNGYADWKRARASGSGSTPQ